MTVRIFVAFDVEHDRDLFDRMVASAGTQGGFEVCGHSHGGEICDAWQHRTATQIAEAEQVVVVCSAHTDACERVAAELQIARQQSKPVVLLWSRRESECKKPAGARPDDSMYSWTPEILRDQLLLNQRKSLSSRVPDALKRRPQAASEIEN